MPEEEEILRRGLEAFAELGYAGASVRELARRLDVSHNFINDRYGSKDAFWRAAVSSELARTTAQLDVAISADQDDACRFAAVIRAFYRIAAHSPEVNKLMADESTRESDRLDFLYEQYVGPTLNALEPSMNRLIQAGRLAPMPMHVLFLAITGPAISLTQDPLRRMGKPEPSTAEDVTRTADALATLVLDGLLR
jgi:TetR/AcrR family transcriptional regulator